MIFEPLDLSLLGLKHLLDKEHFPLLFNKLISVLLVLRALDRDSKACSFSHIDLALDLRVDSEGRRFNVCLTYLPKATFSGRPIFFPDLKLLALFFLL